MWIPSTPLATRATPVTASNKSTAITIATWTLMITFVLMFLSREVIKFVVLRRLGLDDILIAAATILGICLSATILTLASHGLGVLQQLTIAQAETLMKGYYASDLLYVSSLCFCKLSLIVYFYNIFIQRTQRRVVLGLGIFIAIWTIASLGAIAFQCKLPRPWEVMTLDCYNTGVFWIVYCIIDMTTDVAIIMLSVNLVAYLKVRLSRKVVVVSCFAPRILVISTALTRLVYLFPITPHNDPQFNLWVPIICAQAQVCLAISTACIPYIKPLFEGVEAGGWRADEVRKRGTSNANGYAFSSRFACTQASKKGQELYSIGSTVSLGPKLGRAPDVSPRIPTPAPLSPLTPPRHTISMSSTTSSGVSSRAPSDRGRLTIQIPPVRPCPVAAATTELASPQTASSHALSPHYLSPQPLLPHTASPVRGLTPPPRIHSPRPPIASSHYGDSPRPSPDPSLRSPPRSPNFSLFPSQHTGRYTFKPPNRKAVVQKRFSNHGSEKSKPQSRHPPRSSSMKHWSGRPGPAIKFAVAPNLGMASPSTTIPSYYSKCTKSTPTQSVSTPPTIPSYYLGTPTAGSTPTFSLPQPPSPSRERNKRILSPSNSSRKDQVSPVSPPTPLTFWKDDTSPESSGIPTADTQMRANLPWDIEGMPVVQDVRSSPRITIRKAS